MDRLGLKGISAKDKFVIDYEAGFVTATVKRHGTGTVERSKMHISGNFREMSQFDPEFGSKADRDEGVVEMYRKGMSQAKIADRYGIAQTTVSNILKKAHGKRNGR